MSLKIIQNGTPVEATKIWIGGEIQAECLRVWSTEANAWVYETLAELTGTLPLTFRSNGTALLDYRIYGNTLTTKLNLWEWGNTNYRIDLTTPIAANTTLTYAVFKDGIANNAEGIYLYDANGSRILNAACANTDGNRIYATVTPTRDVHRIELSPMAADALRMLTEGDTPPGEYISPETTEVQGVGVRTENLFDPNAAETSGNNIISDFMPLDPSELVLTMAFDIPLRASYSYDVTYYDSTKTTISFVGGMGEAYKTRETVKLNRQSEAPNAAYVKVTLPKDLTNVLIQNGSTSGEYIPYGYKLPMVSRTGNLFDYVSYFASTAAYNHYFSCANIQLSPNTTYTLSTNFHSGTSGSFVQNRETPFIVCNTVDSPSTLTGGFGDDSSVSVTTVDDGIIELYFRISRGAPSQKLCDLPTLSDFENGKWVMIVEGSTALDHFIPYHRTETPIYIGDTQLMKDEYVSYGEQKIVRKLAKRELTGAETLTSFTNGLDGAKLANYHLAALDMTDVVNYNASMAQIPYPTYISNEFKMKTSRLSSWTNTYAGEISANTIGNNFYNRGIVFGTTLQTANEWKAFLAERYASGNPVTIWYILATPIKEDPPVPLPELPTFSDTDTVLDYEETPAPEEVWVKYHKK